jgi:hypothetical protein
MRYERNTDRARAVPLLALGLILVAWLLVSPSKARAQGIGTDPTAPREQRQSILKFMP